MSHDIVDAATRSRMMSGIRGKDTKPEMLLRRGLHARGFRYTLHSRELPGRPDLTFPRYHAVVFVHGCFWHGHDCSLFRWPKNREAFWREKIEGNRTRDAAAEATLTAQNWRVFTVWECSLRGIGRYAADAVVDSVAAWLRTGGGTGELRGK